MSLSLILAILNPLNWIKVVSSVLSIGQIIMQAWATFQKWQSDRAQKKQIDALLAAENKLKAAQQIKDDADRIKAETEAASSLEKAIGSGRDE